MELSDGLDSIGLTQLVTQPTRRLPGVANLLDIVAASNVSRVTNVSVFEADNISDHCLLSAAVAVCLLKPVVAYTWRSIRNIDTALFEDDLPSLSYSLSQPQTSTRTLINLTACLLRYWTSTLQFALLAAVHPRRSVVGSLMKRSEPSVCEGASNDVGALPVRKLIESTTDGPLVERID